MLAGWSEPPPTPLGRPRPRPRRPPPPPRGPRCGGAFAPDLWCGDGETSTIARESSLRIASERNFLISTS